MSSEYTCPIWRPSDCSGSPDCPPRYPRYVAVDGTTYTVYAGGEAPIRTELSDGSEPGDGVPAPASTARRLTAVADGRLVGVAIYTPAVDTATVTLADGASPAAGTELCRQVIARGVALGGEAMDLLEAYGVPTPEGAVVHSRRVEVDVPAEAVGDVCMELFETVRTTPPTRGTRAYRSRRWLPRAWSVSSA
ncbi:hypothetical protein [Natrononativus amylolyticus]|uniref:hypothetical protein n=1 Tax=Natrononativus amylolyticus TaxID=2963434 RepID=UPI0020CBCD66|nr:hypothetical protein [Natrononativus amylolyticus]